ncbi:GH39 family glycosyl hydrolase [Klebsiella pneumoniae]|uniref:GH39 family glycosyl hydrolase n=1 Tax=Klebsiella pneumoniae TaxID=573 RepID=UPI001ABD143E|nr:helix-turn-helix domain-containing protein [Klebsiella pneumoniae]MBO3721287.1 helix-turn-helix domain-containing protein [Klebsiella pneumoniae]HCM5830591.1 helix-turn-helix domain-containing protein [Klebsiella pneumoniae]
MSLINSFIAVKEVTHPDGLLKKNPNLTVVLVLSGLATVSIGAKDYPLYKDDFFFININSEYKLKADNKSQVIEIALKHGSLNGLLISQGLVVYCHSSGKVNDARHAIIRKAIVELIKAHRYSDEINQLNEASIFYKISHYLVTNFAISPTIGVASKGHNKHNARMSDIISYIEINYRDKISLQDLAEKKYLSQAYLSRFFKSQTGLTFTDYLHKKRMMHAESDVVNTELSILQIALNNGFANVNTFSQKFKRDFGLSPLAYRKQNKSYKNEAEKIKENDLANGVKDSNAQSISPWQDWLSDLDDNNSTGNKVNSFRRDIDVNCLNSEQIIPNWCNLINVGHASDLLDSGVRQHLSLIQSELRFTHARFWGIFNDGILLESPLENGLGYNFDNIDKIIDLLHDLGLYPFIELGPKPKVIHKSKNDDISFTPFISRSKDHDDLQVLLNLFLTHCEERYGRDYIDNWHFELWQRDLDSVSLSYWRSGVRDTLGDTGCNSSDDYYGLLGKLLNTIKGFSLNIKVGGSGFSPLADDNIIEGILKFANNANLDFLSLYIYSLEMISESKSKRFDFNDTNEIMTDFLKSFTKKCKTPLFITEWNATVSSRSSLNDMLFKSAYIVDFHLSMLNHIEFIGYWHASDLFSNSYDSNKLLNGQSGLLSKNGLKKPSFFAYDFLSKLGNRLICKGPGYAVFTNSNKDIQVICYNYKTPASFDPVMFPDSDGDIIDGEFFVDYKSQFLTLTLKGLSDGFYKLKHFRLDENNGSIIDDWMRLGKVSNIQKDEMHYLQNTSCPKMTISIKEVAGSVLRFESQLPPHCVELFLISKK